MKSFKQKKNQTASTRSACSSSQLQSLRKSAVVAALAIATLLATSPANASGGTGAGDGGHGVICDNFYYNRYVQLLDLFEARNIYGFEPELGFDPKKYSSRPDLMQQREFITIAFETSRLRATEALGPKHPFLQTYEKFQGINKRFFQEKEVPRTPDAGTPDPVMDGRCYLIQIARRLPTETGVDFYISTSNYYRLATVDKAGLILHEAFHDWFADYNERTTAVRQAITYLSAPKKFRDANAVKFFQLINSRQPLDDGFHSRVSNDSAY